MSPAAWGPAPPAWLLLPRRVPRVFLSSTTSCPEPTARGWGAVRSCPQAPPQAPPPSARPPPGLPLPRETVTTLCQHERPVCGFEGKKKRKKKNMCRKTRSRRGVEEGRSEWPPRGAPQRWPACSRTPPRASAPGGAQTGSPVAAANTPTCQELANMERGVAAFPLCCKDLGDVTDGSTSPDLKKGRKKRKREGRKEF